MLLKNGYSVKFYIVFVLSQLLCIMFYTIKNYYEHICWLKREREREHERKPTIGGKQNIDDIA